MLVNVGMSRRSERVGELIRETISGILLRQVRDPRLKGLVSVTDVDMSPDLRSARIFVSVLGSEEEKKDVLGGLTAARSFVRRELGEKLGLRYVPDLSFKLDESIERGTKILQLLKEVAPEESDDTDHS